MITFLFLIFFGLAGLVIGAHFYGPILNATGAAVEWVKARFDKKP